MTDQRKGSLFQPIPSPAGISGANSHVVKEERKQKKIRKKKLLKFNRDSKFQIWFQDEHYQSLLLFKLCSAAEL